MNYVFISEEERSYYRELLNRPPERIGRIDNVLMEIQQETASLSKSNMLVLCTWVQTLKEIILRRASSGIALTRNETTCLAILDIALNLEQIHGYIAIDYLFLRRIMRTPIDYLSAVISDGPCLDPLLIELSKWRSQF